MTTDRSGYKVDALNPGSDLAGETAAAMAATALAFRDVNTTYSTILLNHARQVDRTLRGGVGTWFPDCSVCRCCVCRL